MWYFQQGETHQGPASESEIESLIVQGVITQDTMVWKPGMSTWEFITATELVSKLPNHSVTDTQPKASKRWLWMMLGILGTGAVIGGLLSLSESEPIPANADATILFCGEEIPVTSDTNINFDGDWDLEWSGSGAIYRARLIMEGTAGEMIVEFPGDSGPEYVLQAMTLYNSSRGLILQGSDPVDPETEEPVTTYASDSLLVRQSANDFTITNCDEVGNTSPVAFAPWEGNVESEPTSDTTSDVPNDDSIFIGQLEEQLEDIALTVSEEGIVPLRDPFIGRLADGELEIRNLRLAARTDYILVGVCDNDCLEISLELYDENDNFIDEDFESGDTPFVTVRPDWAGSFKLQVNMEDCSESYCYYGLGVFALQE